jgi:hypothetical protein
MRGKSQVPPDDAVRVVTGARQLSPAFGERMSKMWRPIRAVGTLWCRE